MKKRILLLVGCALIVAGVGLFAFPFGYRAMVGNDGSRGYADRWIRMRSHVMRHHSWMHDDFADIGYSGDKALIAELMSSLKPGVVFDNCGGDQPHADEVFCIITNQNLGMKSDDWLKWWTINHGKSQRDWIRDGFAAEGLLLGDASVDDIEPLLVILGQATNNDDSRHLKYNAFRWLRDSGYDVKDIIQKGSDPGSMEAQNGYETYLRFLMLPHIAGFLNEHDDPFAVYRGGPYVPIPASCYVLLASGVAMVILAFIKPRKK